VTGALEAVITGAHPSAPPVDPKASDWTSQPDSPPIGLPG
jgi:hypothetical protein